MIMKKEQKQVVIKHKTEIYTETCYCALKSEREYH